MSAGSGVKKAECVKVVVRCRPLLPNEKAKGYAKVVGMDGSRGEIVLRNPKSRSSDDVKREFTFDAVYDSKSKQVDLYDETFRPIVDAVLEGYNGTIFAYGQTGTGKTYTMEGVRSNPEERGVIPNSFEHIFTHIERTENEQYLVRVSYLEIYQEEIRDLLSKDHTSRLELREKPDTGVYVKGLSSILTKNVKEIEGVMSLGNKNRSVGRTDMNEHSSRSHAIFIVTVECCAAGPDGAEHIRMGKLNLVDLAGSERQSKTGSTGERFKEATKINLSLSALGNVISALVDGKSSHVPYRDSKLTRLLQDSLGGNAKTVMVANVGPADYNYDETLMTLRYANRAKNIKNKPHINEDPKDALLREYQEEIMRLKMALEKRKKGSSGVRKKKRRVNEQGEVVSEEESEGEEEEGGGGERAEVNLKMKQALLEEEKQALLQNKELLDEEKQKLVVEVQKKVDLLKKEQKKRDHLAEMIKKMESKLLAGDGKNVADRADDAKRAREKVRQEMIEHKRREREIRQQLEAKEESTLEIKGTFTSLQEEVDTKTKKLNKLKSKLKAARAEIADYQEEQASVREELALTIEELQRELKLRTLIVENFIPLDEAEKVTQRAFYDEDMDEWKLRPLNTPESPSVMLPRPVSAIGNFRPISIYARMAASNGDPRYMAQNILKVELDMPNRTTREYEGPAMAPTLQDALDAALQDEEEMIIDAAAFTSDDQPRVKGPRTRRRGREPRDQYQPHRSLKTVPEEGEPNVSGAGGAEQRSTSGSKTGQKPQQFPTSRGLVTRPVRFA